MHFYWIDDDKRREHAAKNLENYFNRQKIKSRGEFINLCRKDFDDFKSIFNKPAPDLIIVDHFLNNSTNKIITKGSSVAEIVRQRWPQCPIVGVTAAEKEARVAAFSKDSYEDLFSIDNREEMFAAALILAVGFRTLRKIQIRNSTRLAELLNPPHDETENIKRIIPLDISRDLNDRENVSLKIKISRWVRRTLLARPGPLYDSLWAATMIGIKEVAFIRISSSFCSAQYSGIFSNYSGFRWWRGALLKKLYDQLKLQEPRLPWLAGHSLKGITKKDYALCAACHKLYPEIVAYNDRGSTIRHPMHLKCTEAHPDYDALPSFEEIRMMKDL